MEGMGVKKLESVAELEAWVAERTVREVVDALSATAVPVAPVYHLDQMVEDPQVKHRGMIVSLEHPTAGTVRGPNFPVKFSKTPAEVRRPAPLLGQHNDEVLGELGYSREAIDELRKSGVIT